MEERGEYPKIEKLKKEKSKLRDLQSVLIEVKRTKFSVMALAFRFPKFKPEEEKLISVIKMFDEEITRVKENVEKYSQPSRRAIGEATEDEIISNDSRFSL